MGKKGKSSGSSAAEKPSRCECEHPFQCDCGNRPERPSRGHRWDSTEQKWGGKGHRQKGGSGQTSQVAVAAKTTAVGKTEVAQWQRLPSQLLADVCKRERRPNPKYKSLSVASGKYQYRVIVQDAKANKRGGEHDLILVPASPVQNEEQAREESALLALLLLTPSLPHERKLPDPYKATWVHAVQNRKEKMKTEKQKAKIVPENSNSIDERTTKEPSLPSISSNSGSSNGAAASTNLSHAQTFTSLAEKRKQQDAKRKLKLDKIRKYEALRMANRDVQVFMSAQVRKQIEALLRGGANTELLNSLQSEDSEMEVDEDEDEDVVRSYVMLRLVTEGFTTSQARAGYSATLQNPSTMLKNIGRDEDEYMDKVYEESLQWLCVHLNEDQLPEGFDPRGRTLDVVVVSKGGKPSSEEKGGEAKPKTQNKLKIVNQLIHGYGVTLEEARLIFTCISDGKVNGEDVKCTIWEALCNAGGIDALSKLDSKPLAMSPKEREDNEQNGQDEIEVLEAMFPSEDDYNIKYMDNIQTGDKMVQINIALPCMESEGQASSKRVLNICYRKGAYPMEHPKVFIMGGWGSRDSTTLGLGTAVHIDMAAFVATLPKGEPMIFELFGFAQEVIQKDGEELENGPAKTGLDSRLLPYLDGGKELIQSNNTESTLNRTNTESDRHSNSNGHKSGSRKRVVKLRTNRRPREKSFFWSKSPKDTPPAYAFPKISASMKRTRNNLPANKARAEFLRIMKVADEAGRVVLVTGETGCGKTTQIPQFILEEAPVGAKIVVAQPRRLAATGVAGRVADERGENKPGEGSVGFVVRGEVAMCNRTRIMFCTTGVLLRQLQSDGALDCVTHILVDEVHERHLDSDILLGILKQCLLTTPHLRVVLMSATMDADRFAAYWGRNTPRMHIPGFTHPVEDFTLENVLSLTGYIPPKKGKKKNWHGKSYGNKGTRRSAWNDSEHSDDEGKSAGPESTTTKKLPLESGASNTIANVIPIEELVKRVNESDIDYDLLANLVRHLVQKKAHDDDGSILVFLPGAPEIARAQEVILRITRGANMTLLPLHGGLQPRDQQKVFLSSRSGNTKVILSTNVAETSITIPDCTVVIDTCREKQSSYDPSNRMPMLVEKFASRDSLKQRRGRAGRVRPGSCYKLISRNTFEKLPEHGEPEIKRCALDQTLLSLLFLGLEMGSGAFLSDLLDPPAQESIDAAIESLEKLGALTVSSNNGDTQLALTPLGMHLAAIPAPPCVGKMIIMGALLGCRSAALSVAAGMSVGRSPFFKINTFRRNNNSSEDSMEDKDAWKNKCILDERLALFKSVGNSDHAMLAAAFTQWDNISGGYGEKKRYCDNLGLSLPGMRDMKQLVRQLDGSLCSAGYHPTQDSDVHAQSPRIIRSCIVSALAPNQLVRVLRPSTKYAETSEGALEKDGVAKELKFFTRVMDDEKNKDAKRHYGGVAEERVFIHPSSSNFAVGSYSCPWLVYNELVRTSKPFLRDATECSSYALLLFGGQINVRAAEGLIVIDNYLRLSANARIGALIGGLRRKVDDLLAKKVENPSLDVANSVEMKLIVKLLRTDGLGQ